MLRKVEMDSNITEVFEEGVADEASMVQEVQSCL